MQRERFLAECVFESTMRVTRDVLFKAMFFILRGSIFAHLNEIRQ